MTPSVTVEHRGPVAVVTLNRPDRRNGVTVEMCEELYQQLRELPASDSRVVILRGAGDDFSVGADLGGRGADSSLPRTYERLDPIYHAATLLHSMTQNPRSHSAGRKYGKLRRARIGPCGVLPVVDVSCEGEAAG
jgi:2-(1,2-epoxy-1,2-dihydrophenyl)acetyl-CoA isomerase